MKKKLILSFCFMMLFIFIPNVYAEAKTGYVTSSNSNLKIRTTPTVSDDNILLESDNTNAVVLHGDIVTITSEVAGNPAVSDCPSNKWYGITYNSHSGYVCSDFITVNNDESSNQTSTTTTTTETSTGCLSGSAINTNTISYDFETELAKFPASYQDSLRKLHNSYPNWRFYAEAVDIKFNSGINKGNTMTWNDILDGEQSSSSIYMTNSSSDGYTSFLDSITPAHYNWRNNTWTHYGDSGEVYYASKDAIAYYMDPRNFLNERNIFMFEDSRLYTYQSSTVAKDILDNGGMTTFKNNDGTTINYIDAFMASSSCSLISPNMLIARVRVETDNGKSNSVNGIYSQKFGLVNNVNLDGYYNYFNVGAFKKNGLTAIQNGLLYAKDAGWNDRYKAITEGSSFLANSYVYYNQETQYYQKYNVKNQETQFIHQFMTNFQAPFTESEKVYFGYKDTNSMQLPITFHIPVYKDMPSSASVKPHDGNPNNWLSQLTINGTAVSGFDGDDYYSYDNNYDGIADNTYDTNVFTYTVDYNVTSINVDATKAYGESSVAGIGSIQLDLNAKEEIKDVVVTAVNGTTKTYRIKVLKKDAPATDENGNIIYPSIPDVLNTTGAKYNNQYLYGFNMGTKRQTLIDTIYNKSSLINTTITPNANNKTKAIATGDTIIIQSGNNVNKYTYVLYGDTDGDGESTIFDILDTRRIMLNASNLSGANLKAADADQNGTVDIFDIITIRLQMLGQNIKQ